MMTTRVSDDKIEALVGAYREESRHIARISTREGAIYILHPNNCKRRSIDLRLCSYSESIDKGLDEAEWEGNWDKPMYVKLIKGKVLPRGSVPKSKHYIKGDRK